jgi:hypothetical protein
MIPTLDVRWQPAKCRVKSAICGARKLENAIENNGK